MDVGVGIVVLCGGTSARLGGADKTARRLGDATVLDHLLAGLPQGCPIVCVGQERPVCRPVTWTQERPERGGPVAGVAAGLAALPGDPGVVVVLAGDQPFAGYAVRRLVDALTLGDPGLDAVCATGDDRPQLLLAAYRAAALRRALTGADLRRGVYRTMAALRVATLRVPELAALDIDTPADLARARAHAADPSHRR